MSETSTTAEPDTPARRPGLGLFLRQVIAELRKVVWPTRSELLSYTGVVLVFVLVMMLLVAGLDYGLGKLVLLVFGSGS
ncbi:preprotein translocase subunit SecE [Kineococcus xinjiangensis]|uniref:Protein translocase subunit SecE n=1 Tax=Kineococcus xinjiangensis TaxID=512762 RepID=A0A2S6ITD7_9ACTN|nr:preprotein translocase subunit SecE [Kineococcus xinjiangensis]PPK97524.1 preprotein translocase subunit SecE [Kineococcus xinjiangensis]